MTDVHTIIQELTTWHQHRQPYTHELNGTTYDTHHTTQIPPLIQQLAEAEPASNGDSSQRSTPGSRPAARIDALDTLNLIDHAAAAWIRKLGEDDPGNTIACIKKLYGLAAGAHFCNKPATKEGRNVICCDTHKIERDLRTWWTQARIITGHDTQAWAPNNTCPMCAERRSLRIRLDDHQAMCTSCRETWDTGSIGLLAEHIRAENGEDIAS